MMTFFFLIITVLVISVTCEPDLNYEDSVIMYFTVWYTYTHLTKLDSNIAMQTHSNKLQLYD